MGEDRERANQEHNEQVWIEDEVKRRGKQAWIAWLLWAFTGMVGGHRFYLGQTNTAIAQLILFIVAYATMIILVGFAVYLGLALWVLVDAFQINKMLEESRIQTRGEVERDLRLRKDLYKQ